mgnify:CR=1 FL=1
MPTRRDVFRCASAIAAGTGLLGTLSATAAGSVSEPEIPYQPIRGSLYTREDLFHGYLAASPVSWSETPDFRIYRNFVRVGKIDTASAYESMMQALHDNSISRYVRTFVAGQRVAAIMGGHKMARNSSGYKSVALISQKLSESGVLVCSGGGPGAMEATHLGARMAGASPGGLDAAIATLATQPTVPELANVVAPDGSTDPALIAAAHSWFKPAHQLAEKLASSGKPSLAIPTWHYGFEPTTPFASHIAKYFQNSIREDGLLALAGQGIIFAEGKAGTIQEIFQDSAQNYYRSFGTFSPMVLLGEKYWTEKYPGSTPVFPPFLTAFRSGATQRQQAAAWG